MKWPFFIFLVSLIAFNTFVSRTQFFKNSSICTSSGFCSCPDLTSFEWIVANPTSIDSDILRESYTEQN